MMIERQFRILSFSKLCSTFILLQCESILNNIFWNNRICMKQEHILYKRKLKIKISIYNKYNNTKLTKNYIHRTNLMSWYLCKKIYKISIRKIWSFCYFKILHFPSIPDFWSFWYFLAFCSGKNNKKILLLLVRSTKFLLAISIFLHISQNISQGKHISGLFFLLKISKRVILNVHAIQSFSEEGTAEVKFQTSSFLVTARLEVMIWLNCTVNKYWIHSVNFIPKSEMLYLNLRYTICKQSIQRYMNQSFNTYIGVFVMRYRNFTNSSLVKLVTKLEHRKTRRLITK